MAHIEHIEKPLHPSGFPSGSIIKMHKWPDNDDAKLDQAVYHVNAQAPDDNIHGNIGDHTKHLFS